RGRHRTADRVDTVLPRPTGCALRESVRDRADMPTEHHPTGMSAVASSGVSNVAVTRRTCGETTAYAMAAARVATATTTAMDRPLMLPPRPTSTLPDAPIAMRAVPKKAEAVPAASACNERARAVEFGPTVPTAATS